MLNDEMNVETKFRWGCNYGMNLESWFLNTDGN